MRGEGGGGVGTALLSWEDKGSGSLSASELLLLRTARAAAIAGPALYWYIQQRWRDARLQLKEDEARAFFSIKSASGNKY